MNLGTPQPLEQAVAKISAKTPIGSVLRSAEWADMPLALRERAQFSAGVESVRLLQAVQDKLLAAARLQRERTARGDALVTRQSFINDLRDMARDLGLDPRGAGGDPTAYGTLRDITHFSRLGMIWDIQTESAYAHARWKMDQDPDVLDAFPAQELIRVEDRMVPRDWEERWIEAGGEMVDGRMVALKGDPIWTRISAFGTPWPPFDYRSGMGLEDVDREEAERLGLLEPGQPVQPEEADFNEGLQASARGLSPEFRDVLREHFGDQIAVDQETIQWKGAGADHEQGLLEQRKNHQSLFRGSEEALGSVGLGVHGAEEHGGLEAQTRYSAAAQASSVAAGQKLLYHEQLTPDSAAETAAALRKSLPPEVEVRADGPHVYAWRPDRLKLPFAEIRAATERGENGILLGYGQASMTTGSVPVLILDPEGRTVAGFWGPRESTRLFAAARAQDFTDATGRRHAYRIIEP